MYAFFVNPFVTFNLSLIKMSNRMNKTKMYSDVCECVCVVVHVCKYKGLIQTHKDLIRSRRCPV